MAELSDETTKDFFISYASADREWAEWIGWQLIQNGHEVVIQAWDFRPEMNFIEQMNTAPKHETTADALNENGLILIRLGEPAQARTMFERALSTLRELRGHRIRKWLRF